MAKPKLMRDIGNTNQLVTSSKDLASAENEISSKLPNETIATKDVTDLLNQQLEALKANKQIINIGTLTTDNNMNDYNYTCMGRATAPTNLPSWLHYGNIFVIKEIDYITQLATRVVSNSMSIGFRASGDDGATWSDWKQIATTDITSSLSGQINTLIGQFNTLNGQVSSLNVLTSCEYINLSGTSLISYIKSLPTSVHKCVQFLGATDTPTAGWYYADIYTHSYTANYSNIMLYNLDSGRVSYLGSIVGGSFFGWQQIATLTDIDNLKSFVSNGKNLVANAITGKGISTSASDTFATMATNVSNIKNSLMDLVSFNFWERYVLNTSNQIMSDTVIYEIVNYGSMNTVTITPISGEVYYMGGGALTRLTQAVTIDMSVNGLMEVYMAQKNSSFYARAGANSACYIHKYIKWL